MEENVKYKIRKLEIHELDLLVPLMNDCFGLEVTIDFFKWKCRDNPAGSFIGFIAETNEGKPAAYYGVIPERYTIEGVEQVIYQGSDIMTHPKHRRKGLLTLLATTCYTYLREQKQLFVIGFSGDFSTPGLLKAGRECIDKVYQLFYPRFFALFLFVNRSKYKIREIGDIEEIGHLLFESNRQTAIHSLKDVRTFSWRICNPLHRYQLYGVYDEGTIVGYFCFYYYKNRIYIFDFYCTDQRAVTTILQFFKKLLTADKRLVGIQSFGSRYSYMYQTLRKKGFIKTDWKKGGLNLYLSFVFLAEKQKMDKYRFQHFWNFTPFDHDSL